MGRQPGFFDVEDRMRRLSDLGDQLEAYAATVDFECFRADLEAALAYSDGAKGGRPPYDPVLMFKACDLSRRKPGSPGHSGPEQSLRRAHGVSDQRPAFLHAFPRPRLG